MFLKINSSRKKNIQACKLLNIFFEKKMKQAI